MFSNFKSNLHKGFWIHKWENSSNLWYKIYDYLRCCKNFNDFILGFMLAYYTNFSSKLSKKTLGIFLLIEIFILVIYVFIKKYCLQENFVYLYDFNALYFFLLIGENIFLLLHQNHESKSWIIVKIYTLLFKEGQ